MKFHDIFLLLLEKRVFSNKLSVDMIIPIYHKAIALTF